MLKIYSSANNTAYTRLYLRIQTASCYSDTYLQMQGTSTVNQVEVHCFCLSILPCPPFLNLSFLPQCAPYLYLHYCPVLFLLLLCILPFSFFQCAASSLRSLPPSFCSSVFAVLGWKKSWPFVCCLV